MLVYSSQLQVSDLQKLSIVLWRVWYRQEIFFVHSDGLGDASEISSLNLSLIFVMLTLQFRCQAIQDLCRSPGLRLLPMFTNKCGCCCLFTFQAVWFRSYYQGLGGGMCCSILQLQLIFGVDVGDGGQHVLDYLK
ncbi:hypothetical protein ACOSP7_005994 [Xanthoceras sorbifolium]